MICSGNRNSFRILIALGPYLIPIGTVYKFLCTFLTFSHSKIDRCKIRTTVVVRLRVRVNEQLNTHNNDGDDNDNDNDDNDNDDGDDEFIIHQTLPLYLHIKLSLSLASIALLYSRIILTDEQQSLKFLQV